MSYLTELLVSSAKVKNHTGEARDVEDRKLAPRIHLAQKELQEILGETLYALLETAYVGNSTTLGGAGMLALYTSYVSPFLCWKTLEKATLSLRTDAARNGEFERNGNDYATVSFKETDAKRGENRSNAETYQVDMIRYIKNLDDADPIRVAFYTDIDDEPRVKESYRGNIALTRNPWQTGGNVCKPNGRYEC